MWDENTDACAGSPSSTEVIGSGERGKVGGIVEFPIFFGDGDAAQHRAVAGAGCARADSGNQGRISEVVNPDRGESLIVDVEGRQEFADYNGEVRIYEIVQLKVVDVRKSLGMPGSA